MLRVRVIMRVILNQVADLSKLHLLILILQLDLPILAHTLVVHSLITGNCCLRNSNGYQDQMTHHKLMLKLLNSLEVGTRILVYIQTFSVGGQCVEDSNQKGNNLGQPALVQSQQAMFHQSHNNNSNSKKPQLSLRSKLRLLLLKKRKKKPQSRRKRKNKKHQLLKQLVVQLMNYSKFLDSVISGLVKLSIVKSMKKVTSFTLSRLI